MANGDNLPVVYHEQQPSIVRYASGGGGGGNVVLAVGVVAVVAVAAGAIWYAVFRKEDSIKKYYSFKFKVLTPIVPVGGEVKVEVTIKNISTETQNPELRFDISPSSWGHTPKEGDSEFVGDMEAGEEVVYTISRVLYADWGAGTTIRGQLMLIGSDTPIWGPIDFAVVQSEFQTLIVESVEAVNPLLVAGAGARARVKVRLTNTTAAPIVRQFRLDLKVPLIGNTWIEYEPRTVGQTFSIPPGTSDIVLDSIPVPTNWGASDLLIAIKIMDLGMKAIFYGDLAGSEVYRLFKIVSTPQQAFIEITSRGIGGLESAVVPVGVRFMYTIAINNKSTSPIPITLIFGLRSQTPGDLYEAHSNTSTITIPPGPGEVDIYSTIMGSGWAGYVLDMRVLIKKGANIFVTNSQGEVTSNGVATDIIYEGSDVARVSTPSQLSGYSGESFVISMTPVDRIVSTNEAISFTLGVNHRGLAKRYKAGCYIKTKYPYWITQEFDCPESAQWETVQVTVSGTFHNTTGLGSGNVIDVQMAFMEASINPTVPTSDSQLLLANWDAILKFAG
jgi:hypothetical protein